MLLPILSILFCIFFCMKLPFSESSEDSESDFNPEDDDSDFDSKKKKKKTATKKNVPKKPLTKGIIYRMLV